MLIYIQLFLRCILWVLLSDTEAELNKLIQLNVVLRGQMIWQWIKKEAVGKLNVYSKVCKTTLLKEVSNGDSKSVIDQDILPTMSTRIDQACIRAQSVLKKNPVRKFEVGYVSK